MRVLFLSTEFPPGPGGIGTHAYQLASGLAERGWDVAVLSSQDYVSDAAIAAFNAGQPFPIVRLESIGGAPRRLYARARRVLGFAREWKPDLIVASGDRATWLGAWLSGRVGVPWVAIGHGGEFRMRLRWQRALVRWAFRRATAVVTVSRYTRQQMLLAGIQPRREQVVPNGADDAQFREIPAESARAFRAEHGLEDAIILLTVGRVYERKGQDVVIRALPRLVKEYPRLHYVAVGIPTREPEFAALAESVGVAGHVHFLGALDAEQLLRCLNAADLFVMTSRHSADGDFEGYGIAVVEAALCGKAAVVSGNSGLAEAIVDGKTGLCVPEEDAEATAEGILTLLRDPDRLARMGESARARARAEQTWSHRIDEYAALFRSLPGAGR